MSGSLRAALLPHLEQMYSPDEVDLGSLAARLVTAMGISSSTDTEGDRRREWGPQDTILITYGDTIIDPGRPPMSVLDALVDSDLARAFSAVHILPFFPSSSDRGFAVIDHRQVDPLLGTWEQVEALAGRVELMVDLVCNHRSASSVSFRQFIADEEPGRSAFVTVDDGTDLTAVVRPRPGPLAHTFMTSAGPRNVWCTFGPDQVDVDITNPDVLVDLVETLRSCVDHGARMVRLDAIAYLWKAVGTSCIHDPRTHATVRLWRALLRARRADAVVITETNVPHEENLSYLGDGDEADVVYNFTLGPLVVDAVMRGSCRNLNRWALHGSQLPSPAAYLNVLTTHDGIGVRPVEGILTDDEIGWLVGRCEAAGGSVRHYDASGTARPYELNVALWDLFAAGEEPGVALDDLRRLRLECSYAIVFAMSGIPGVYINTLLAQGNALAEAEATGIERDITRGRIPLSAARSVISGKSGARGRACRAVLDLLALRRRQPAFAPAASERCIESGDAVFVIERVAVDGSQRIVAVHNVTNETVVVDPGTLGLDPTLTIDLITGSPLPAFLGPYRYVWVSAGPESIPNGGGSAPEAGS